MKRILTAFIIATSSAALAETPTFPKNEPYATARESLLKQGWRPVHAPDPGFVCEKGDRRCEGRPETVACAGTGLANCLFRWERKKTVIEIETVGEGDPTVTGVKCKTNCR
jgi:hypothetical protein